MVSCATHRAESCILCSVHDAADARELQRCQAHGARLQGAVPAKAWGGTKDMHARGKPVLRRTENRDAACGAVNCARGGERGLTACSSRGASSLEQPPPREWR